MSGGRGLDDERHSIRKAGPQRSGTEPVSALSPAVCEVQVLFLRTVLPDGIGIPHPTWPPHRAQSGRSGDGSQPPAGVEQPPQVQTTASDRGAPIWHDQTKLGFLLHAAEGQGKGERRIQSGVLGLQPAPCRDYFGHGQAVEAVKSRFLGRFGSEALCGAPEYDPGPRKFWRGVALESGSDGESRCAGLGKGGFFHNLRQLYEIMNNRIQIKWEGT